MGCIVHVHRSTSIYPPTDWQLAYQLVTFDYGDGQTPEHGYRSIWIRPNGTLQAARGQARIPSYGAELRLRGKAMAEGWLFHTEEEVSAYVAGFTGAAWSPRAGMTEEEHEVAKAAFLTGARHRIRSGQAQTLVPV